MIHTNIADEKGNAYVDGAFSKICIMAKAARSVIVTAEKIIDSASVDGKPQIPGFLVESVVLAEKGAAPGSCAPLYSIDEDEVPSYLQNPESYLERKGGRYACLAYKPGII